jgi:hypothetical protein
VGNGSRLITIDIETCSLSSNDLVITAQSSSGRSHIWLGSGSMLQTMDWSPYPEFRPTPWADFGKLTKREQKLAHLHTLLCKLNLLQKFDPSMWDELVATSRTRLKRAKWSRNRLTKKVAR